MVTDEDNLIEHQPPRPPRCRDDHESMTRSDGSQLGGYFGEVIDSDWSETREANKDFLRILGKLSVAGVYVPTSPGNGAWIGVPTKKKISKGISFNKEWRQNIDLAHSYLEKAARRMKKHTDKNRRSQEFNVGDKVMVKLLPQDRKFLRGRDSRLLQKYEGPLTIVKKIGEMAYKVEPPHWWSRQHHPVFHVSMFKPFYEDTTDPSRGQIRKQGLKPKLAGKRVIEAILNDRVITAYRKSHQEYLVKWQGQMDEENTWEPAADLSAYAN
ncbi:hypothetical protein RJ639_016777 [Escallonia herrerae]|uniref:Chromo domain-containing protein n=1 Tax=Escallonia herrerae TaxID=1293975 RepID=A0AA88VEP4_9ASTE|nr:hypothetical protein RJ639_016777 [Escallonia herrerae]